MILKGTYTHFFRIFLMILLAYPLLSTPQSKTSERITFIARALQYLGTPYRYAGRSAKGMDCSGLVYRTSADVLGLQLPRRSDAIAEYTKRITDTEIQPGDLLFFNTTGKISHVGIYLGAGQFIHSASDGQRTGVIISYIQESYWKKAYRFAGSIMKPEEIFFAEAAIPFFSRTLKNCTLHSAIRVKK